MTFDLLAIRDLIRAREKERKVGKSKGRNEAEKHLSSPSALPCYYLHLARISEKKFCQCSKCSS